MKNNREVRASIGHLRTAWDKLVGGRPVRARRGPRADVPELAESFVAADRGVYPVGPCGYVPRSALVDPARVGNPRSLRRWGRGKGARGRRARSVRRGSR